MEDPDPKNIIKNFPAAEPSAEFYDELFDKLENRAEELYENKEKKDQNKSFFAPWQMSLAFGSFVFMLVFGMVLVLSPSTWDNLVSYTDNEVSADRSNGTVVINDYNNQSILIYEVSDNTDISIDATPTPSVPLDIDVFKSEDVAEFVLKNGKYRIVIIQDGDTVLDQMVEIDDEVGVVELEV